MCRVTSGTFWPTRPKVETAKDDDGNEIEGSEVTTWETVNEATALWARPKSEISDDEYERTRAVIIAKTTGKDAESVRLDAIRKAGGLVAEPGYDLTGAPLPGAGAVPPRDGPHHGIPDNGEDA
mgnify:CR=1 FL=1